MDKPICRTHMLAGKTEIAPGVTSEILKGLGFFINGVQFAYCPSCGEQLTTDDNVLAVVPESGERDL